MPKYRNKKPSILGLNFSGQQIPRTVQPDEVFEASADDIPKVYFDQGWIVEEKSDAPLTNQSAPDGTSGQYEGPNPVQRSGTSVLKSETDKAAAESGAYDNHDEHGRRKK